MFERILIANRGEIAVRIARTCTELGVESIGVHSDLDATARHVRAVHSSVHLPGSSPAETYLDASAILQAAHRAEVEAIHPGYGFLSESADFAEAVLSEGFVWIGPPAAATRSLGDKISARRLAEAAGVPVVPGLSESVTGPSVVADFGREHGFPLAIKAAGGGGGRGLKVVSDASEVEGAFEAARREAEAYFGSVDVFVERYLASPKHLEVQILAPASGGALWLGVRDCSLQRRHQKLIEETPPPLHSHHAPAMGEAATALAEACGYVGAGTAEFLVDGDGSFYFLELNARLQVEHTVTEEVYGLDLVECQLRIASGEPLGFEQDDLVLRGHSLQCRINAEDPALSFAPSPGKLVGYVEPSGLGVRVDSGYTTGDAVPDAYDSLIAKVVTWGENREHARRRMLRALAEFDIQGVATTIPAHQILLESEVFIAGTHTTTTVESGALADLPRPDPAGAGDNVLRVGGASARLWNPAMAAAAPAASAHLAAGTGAVMAPMQGTVLKVLVSEGEDVEVGRSIAVLEAMKMETSLVATVAGKVTSVAVAPGDSVAGGQLIATIE